MALAWRILTHDKGRTTLAVAGVFLTILLVFVQLGFFIALPRGGFGSRRMRARFPRAASIGVFMFSLVMLTDRETAADSPDWIDWNGANFFEPCQDDCDVSLSGGRQISMSMIRIMLAHNPVPPWQWTWGDAGIVDGEFSWRLATFWHALDLEPRVGFGKRFGDMQAAEFWGAVA